jgi:formylglycine-generating enzyme required for sulfatase activity
MSAVVIIAGLGAVATIMIRRQHAPPESGAQAQPRHETAASIPSRSLPETLEDHGSMLLVPAGEFVFGDDSQDSPNPKQRISLPAYYIDQTEVPNREYKRFCEASADHAPKSCTTLGREEYPVTNVTWEDANAYAQWATKRIPTEQEWEKAARGSNGQVYPWGDVPWTDGVPDELQLVTYGNEHKSPVGALNMAGNVWEWTTTPFPATERYYALPQNASFSHDWYVIKGGTFLNAKTWGFFRTFMRFGQPKDQPALATGFRCVRTAASSQ